MKVQWSELFRRSRAMQVGVILTALALLVYVIGLFTPLNSGVPRAPGRIVLDYVYTIFDVGLIVMMWAWFAAHKTWLVPWYQEGMKIEVLSSNRVVRTALVAAACIVFSFVKIPLLGWSIRTVAPIFGAMYFGLLEGVLGAWIGYMIGTLIVGGYESPLITIFTSGIDDGVAVALVAVIYWAWIREVPDFRTRVKRYAVMLVVGFVLWYANMIFLDIGYLGLDVIVPYAIQILIAGFLVLAVIVVVAIGTVEVLRRRALVGATPPAG